MAVDVNRLWIHTLFFVLGYLAGFFDNTLAADAALVGFSDTRGSLERAGAASVHSGATGARIVTGWNTDPSDLTGAIEQLGLTTPIITLYTISDVDPTEYGERCAAMARVWSHAIIQAGNEPNIHIGGFQPVRDAVEQAQACERAVHAVDPTTVVLGPAIAPVNVADAEVYSMDYAAYLRGDNAQWHRYMALVYGSLEHVAVAMNIYPYGQDPFVKLRKDLSWGQSFGLPVYITETAMLGPYGRHQAAKLSAIASRRLPRWGARSVMFHRLLQDSGDPYGWHTWAINAQGKRTALYRALKGEWR